MPFKRDPSRRLLAFAKDMRREATDAEKKLWRILRGRRLAGFKFRRQVPVAGFIVDFYCVKQSLVVEADGGQHNDADHQRSDARRTVKLAELGIRVLRFPDDEVLKFPDAVAESIYAELTGENTEPSPLPSPGVPGEGGDRSMT
jgi:very-short-patch-repair endonuclease